LVLSQAGRCAREPVDETKMNIDKDEEEDQKESTLVAVMYISDGF
jgi:hypothetical protein